MNRKDTRYPPRPELVSNDLAMLMRMLHNIESSGRQFIDGDGWMRTLHELALVAKEKALVRLINAEAEDKETRTAMLKIKYVLCFVISLPLLALLAHIIDRLL